jgi:hypothetical protein
VNTHGVRERPFGSPNYEHLYCEEITDGTMLADEAERYRTIFTAPAPRSPRHEVADVYMTAIPDFETRKTEPSS